MKPLLLAAGQALTLVGLLVTMPVWVIALIIYVKRSDQIHARL